MALDDSYAAAVIDVMLPGLDGLAVIDELRRRQVKLPEIIVSAKRSVQERVAGLHAGGDDYLTKPFAFSVFERRQSRSTAEFRGMNFMTPFATLTCSCFRLPASDSP